jgi:hypothetical protein
MDWGSVFGPMRLAASLAAQHGSGKNMDAGDGQGAKDWKTLGWTSFWIWPFIMLWQELTYGDDLTINRKSASSPIIDELEGEVRLKALSC